MAVVLLGVAGIHGPIVYSMHKFMGPTGLGNRVAVQRLDLQGLQTSQIKGYFQNHPEIITETMLRGLEANPDAFVEMLVRSGLFHFQKPRKQSFMQRSFQSATRSIVSIFGRGSIMSGDLVYTMGIRKP